MTSALQTDARLLSTLRAELEQSLNDLTKTTLLIEGYKAGPQSPKHQEAKLNAGNFPYEYFRRKADEMKDRVKRYRSTMDVSRAGAFYPVIPFSSDQRETDESSLANRAHAHPPTPTSKSPRSSHRLRIPSRPPRSSRP